MERARTFEWTRFPSSVVREALMLYRSLADATEYTSRYLHGDGLSQIRVDTDDEFFAAIALGGYGGFFYITDNPSGSQQLQIADVLGQVQVVVRLGTWDAIDK